MGRYRENKILSVSWMMVIILFITMPLISCGGEDGDSNEPGKISAQEFKSQVITGGSRAVARSLPSPTASENSPEIGEVKVSDNVVQSGNNVDFDVLFTDRDADVSTLCCQVNGESGYLEFNVENSSGITNGKISTTVQTKGNTASNRYELKIVLVDSAGNVSESVTVIVTIIPDKNADLGISNCVSGNNPSDLTGTWDLTYTIVEVPAIAEDMLLGQIINEPVEITQSGTHITARYPQINKIFYGTITGNGKEFSFGFTGMAELDLQELDVYCSFTFSENLCGTLHGNSFDGEVNIIYFDIGGDQACFEAKDELGSSWRIRATITGTKN